MDAHLSQQRARLVASLPEPLRRAQEAIQTHEVQQMLQRLAEFNLGICMPHMHTEAQDFAPIPTDTVQVESNLRVSFAVRSEVPANSLPVAWRWEAGQGVRAGTVCEVIQCVVVNTPFGEGHREFHQKMPAPPPKPK